MKAYHQGSVDFFCGIYAVINSCRYAGRQYHKFTYDEGCEFYQHLMRMLIDKGLILEVLRDGSSYDIMQMYLSEASKYMQDNFGLRMIYKRPFTWFDVPIKRACSIVAKFLKHKNAASIVRFENSHCGDHWSMISKCPYPLSKLNLLDSVFYPHLDSDRCKWNKGKNSTYIAKEGLIFIKIIPL